MKEQKSLIYRLAEAYEQYRAERRAASAGEAPPQQPGRVRAFLRWLTPNGGTLLLVALLILTQNVWAHRTAAPAAPGPAATTVNYQGRLADSDGNPLSGVYGMTFALYDAPTGGNLVWGPESHTAVTVSDGLFSVGLGSQTSGGIPTNVWNGDRYLEVTVGGEALSPRELIRSVPIAGMALTVPDGSITTAQMASMTGIVWKTPPYMFQDEGTVWSTSENATWDIGALLDSAGVPDDAEMILLGWRPSLISDVSKFTLRDADGDSLGNVYLGTNLDNYTYAAVGMEYGSPIPVPGAVRQIEYSWVGGYKQEPAHPRRMLYVYGWR